MSLDNTPFITFKSGDNGLNGKGLLWSGQGNVKQLIFNSKELFSADYAILVTLIGDRTQPHINSHFIVWGDISREKFLSVCFEKDFGYGVRFVCNLEDLGQELNAVSIAQA